MFRCSMPCIYLFQLEFNAPFVHSNRLDRFAPPYYIPAGAARGSGINFSLADLDPTVDYGIIIPHGKNTYCSAYQTQLV